MQGLLLNFKTHLNKKKIKGLFNEQPFFCAVLGLNWTPMLS